MRQERESFHVWWFREPQRAADTVTQYQANGYTVELFVL
jgi:hypothetical protein